MTTLTLAPPTPTHSVPTPNLDARIRAALEAYYTPLYRDELCLPDWEAHVGKRMNEDDNFRGWDDDLAVGF